ncbi:hypothetical protein QA601_05810 [Chitinispirillales bacterium ANBcel5]|uniref:hypothetical protein n=1 Tax=Cellulosispirillum alkaliphilum TaxID=3039283 RepID=UPI002A571673|nr:hypothetical protein [Chitinispirillales bacterium ANBcel5]
MDIAQQGYKGEPRQNQATAKTIGTGTLAEGIVGAGAMVVAILGLVGILPLIMLYVATIAVGAALLFEGGAVSSRIGTMARSERALSNEYAELGTGMTAEFLAGAAGVVLGVLALLGIAPITLVSIAAIVYGGALILGSSATARINSLSFRNYETESGSQAAQEALVAASGVQMLVGIGAAVLGILALIGIAPVTLTLVCMLMLGFADIISGGAIGTRVMSMFRR